MILFEPCAKRIAEGKASGEHLVQLFDTLAVGADAAGDDIAEIVVIYLEENDRLIEGQYVPELHLVVRKIGPEDVRHG